jgi:hypothetical protein
VPSHSAIASGSGTLGQQVTVAEATLPVTATSTSLGSLLQRQRRRRRGPLVPPTATCAALAQGACEEDREPPPSASDIVTGITAPRLGHLQSLARWR